MSKNILEKTLNSILKLSPKWMPIGNPIDIWPAVMKHGLKRAYSSILKNVLADSNVDGVLCICVAPDSSDFNTFDITEQLIHIVSVSEEKPVVFRWKQPCIS